MTKYEIFTGFKITKEMDKVLKVVCRKKKMHRAEFIRASIQHKLDMELKVVD